MTRNNYSVLAFHKRLADQHHRKSYAYGKVVPVISDINQIPPFQIIAPQGSVINSVKVIRLEDGAEREVLNEMEIAGFEKHQITIYDVFVYPSRVRLSGDIFEVGSYYIEVSGNQGSFVRYSEVFCMGRIDHSLIKISFCNNGNIDFPNGVISYENYFENFVYFKSEIGKPKYEYEETVVKRDGYNFPLQQISYKLHRFQAYLNEEILDVLRLVQLHDNVKIQVDGVSTDVDEIIVSPVWLEQGDVARTEFEIKTDTVVISNAKASTVTNCEVPQGACFNTDFQPVSTIEFNSDEWNGRYYISNDTGLQVDLSDFDRVVRSIQGFFKLFVYVAATDTYDPVIVSEGQIVYDQNFDRYFVIDENEELFTNSLIKTDTNVRGVTMPNSTIEVWVNFENGSEQLVEIGTAEQYNNEGINYLQPPSAKAVQVRHFSPTCGNYWNSQWIDFENICSFDIQGVYGSIEDAQSDGVQDNEYFLTSVGNNYNIPPYLVMQLNPTIEYDSDNDARLAQGGDTCYPVSAANNHGLPRGVIRALVDTATTYNNDQDANAAGVINPEIYIWNGGNTGFNNLFKRQQLDANGNDTGG